MGLLEELHEQHRARQDRIKQAAFKPKPKAEVTAINEVLGKSNSFELVISEVCEYYEVRKSDLLSRRRMGKIALTRQILTYLMHKLTTYTNGQIGEKLKLDPTTIGYSVKKITRDMDKHKVDLDELEARISQLLAQRKPASMK